MRHIIKKLNAQLSGPSMKINIPHMRDVIYNIRQHPTQKCVDNKKMADFLEKALDEIEDLQARIQFLLEKDND